MASSRATPYESPILAQWDITTGCNFSCTFCLSCSGAPAEGELGPTEATGVLDRLHEGGILFLRVLGGEPFYRHDCLSLLARAADKGMFVSFSTNAALIDAAAARMLARIRRSVNYFQISLYGTNAARYAEVTGDAHALDLVTRGVTRLRAQGLRPYAFWVLTGENVAETEAAYEFARSAGLPALRLSPKLNLGRASGDIDSDRAETPAFWAETVNLLRSLRRRSSEDHGPEVQLHARPLLGEFLFRLTGIPFFFITCKAASTMAYVNARGECSPCPFAEYMPGAFRKELEGRPVSLLRHRLSEAWESPLFRSYRLLRSLESSEQGVFTRCPHYRSGLCDPCLFTPCTCRSSIKLIRQGLAAQGSPVADAVHAVA